jgi:hypothetical protein
VKVTDVSGKVVYSAGTDYKLYPPGSVLLIQRLSDGAIPAGARVLVSYQVKMNTLPNQYVATIDWGNGRQSAGTIAAQADGSLVVRGVNTYALAGTSKIRVSIRHRPTGRLVGTQSTAYIANAPMLSLSPVISLPLVMQQPPRTVFSFLDCNPLSVASDFKASILWGDGTTTWGIVQSAGGGKYNVLGNHNYTAADTYAMTIFLQDTTGQLRSYRVQATVA